ncbi:FG-GAP-like repeat-containing protein [Marinimicrobium sp. ARAG 43.8]|uniref:FG-GAP-like repeat-containing protein n=1 Tax=Marinimicrobium sp. ARAG 43.8 TaxID=3418719 RepID=UPI003CFB1649
MQSVLRGVLLGLTVPWFFLHVSTAVAQEPAQDGEEQLSVEQIVPLVKQYCGGCHAVPHPSLLPRSSWPAVIDVMVNLAEERTGQPYIPEAAVKHIKALYYGNSPEELERLPYIDQSHPKMRFAEALVGEPSPIPQILNIQKVDLGREARHSFLVSDGEAGQLSLLETDGGEAAVWRETPLAQIDIPIKASVADVNNNGRQDILVADLGEFMPVGKLAGKIFLLSQNEQGGFTKKLLMHNLGRVSDVQLADLNGNGHLDIAVSVFGGGDVGEVFWVESRPGETFRKHDLSDLSGALNVTPVDLNGDGRMDLVSLISQEHETLMAFINQGEGQFAPMTIVSGGHPLFGATSLVVADLDQDGDPDLVFTNGDAFDTQSDPKPYHGVQWVENLGDLKFAVHDVGRLYGAANVAVGDLDGDGDLDLVASSWVNYWDDPRRQSLVWFENDGRQGFQPRPISGNFRGLVPLELVDITGNGRLDVLTGAFRMDMVMARANPDSEVYPEPTDGGDSDANPRILIFKNREGTR